jgi:hypothetical protein
MPYVAQRSLSGCGCRGGMGASAAEPDGTPPAAPTIDVSPITDVTGLPPGTTTPPSTFSTGNLLPFVAIGGVAYFLFMRRKRRTR